MTLAGTSNARLIGLPPGLSPARITLGKL